MLLYKNSLTNANCQGIGFNHFKTITYYHDDMSKVKLLIEATKILLKVVFYV